jgi:hypothetical protein
VFCVSVLEALEMFILPEKAYLLEYQTSHFPHNLLLKTVSSLQPEGTTSFFTLQFILLNLGASYTPENMVSTENALARTTQTQE